MGNSLSPEGLKEVTRPLLPMIFVLDSSGSMQGEAISQLNHAMEDIVQIVGDFARTNADALLKIGVLEVHSGADWMNPKGLEEFGDFIYKPLKAGGLTDMGYALTELDSKLSRKGDGFLKSNTGRMKPIIIFMTDGEPTDNWEDPLDNIKNNKWYQNSIRIGFAVGNAANETIISQIVGNSEAVISVDNLEQFRANLRAVALKSAMIGSQSHPPGTKEPSGEDIVKGVKKENPNETEIQTAGDNGVTIDNPDDFGNEDEWGSVNWDQDWDE